MAQGRDKHKVLKVDDLLKSHKAEIMEEMGKSAFDVIPPREAARELGLKDTRSLPELVRQGWLAPAPVEPIGTAKLYHRWRVEFTKRYRHPHSKKNQDKSA